MQKYYYFEKNKPLSSIFVRLPHVVPLETAHLPSSEIKTKKTVVTQLCKDTFFSYMYTENGVFF